MDRWIYHGSYGSMGYVAWIGIWRFASQVRVAEECCRKNQHYQDAEMEIHSGTFSLRKSRFVWDILGMYMFFFFKICPLMWC